MLDFVAIDFETASRSPPRACAVGACAFHGDREVASFESRVRVPGKVRFQHIHGLDEAALADAPTWASVWRNLEPFLATGDCVVAFRAAFDRKVLLAMCALQGLRAPRVRFVCAAEVARRRFGRDLSLAAALRALDLPFPGRPHDPLSDARAAAILYLACADE